METVHETLLQIENELGSDGALLTYRWRSGRGDFDYAALMSSVYARRDGTWRLVLHQQTPEPS